MKNLPDEELFDKLKVQLQNFREEPDADAWDEINAAVGKTAAPADSIYRQYALVLVALLLSAVALLEIQQPFGDMATDLRRKDNKIVGNDLLLHKGADSSKLSGKGNRKDQYDVPAAHLKNADGRPHSNVITEDSATPAFIPFSSRHDTSQVDVAGGQSNLIDGTMLQRQGVDSIHYAAEPATDNFLASNPGSYSTIEGLPQTSKVVATDSTKITTVAIDTSSEAGNVTASKLRRSGRWRVYGLFTPSLTFHQVSPTSSDEKTFLRMNSPGVLSGERLSFSFEGGAQVYLSKRLAAFAGLTYYQQAIDISLEQLEGGTHSTAGRGSGDFSFVPNTVTTTINYSIHNVGVVSGLSYVVSTGKILHQLGGAIQYEFGVGKSSSEVTRKPSSHFFNFRIFYRAEYGINERISIFVQPTFSRTLTGDELLDRAVDVKQSRAGIGFGILYRFD